MKIFVRKCYTCLSVALLAGLVSQPLHAGSSWLSTVTVHNGSASKTQMASSLPNSLYIGSQSSHSVFNLAISLEENPSGDDVYPDDPGTSDDAQNKFEEKIEEFADAVFQMTNSKHKIGKVTIFRDGAQADNADVKWIENCSSNNGPRANPSGFGVPGSRIWFCTNWTGASTAMDTPMGAGFTLAHEWGHYAYGVYDEYVGGSGCNPTCPSDYIPRSTDTPSEPSIMNNQWRAIGSAGNKDYLEFSTEAVEPYLTQADGDDNNAQARVFSESGWKTLTRNSATDPRHSYLPSRTQYTNLVAPPISTPIINDNESTARTELDIIWAGEQVFELTIDNSGSMSGAPIANARTAASLLVGQLAPGENAIGVARFSSSAVQVFPITDIPDPDTGVRTAAQTTIAAMSASGGTNIEGAALSALAEIQGFQGGQRPSVVFLLTDGQSSVNIPNVVNQYVAAGVPLITFGFGSNVDATLLQNLANGTGGQYFYSPTSLQQIQQAFLAANAAYSSNSVVTSSSASSPASSTEIRTIHLDSTLDIASINASYGLSESDVSLRLLDSSGADTGAVFSCNASSEVSCDTQIDVTASGSGEYGVEITNNTSADKDVGILVSATPSSFDSYHIAIDAQNTTYPEGLTLRATVTKGPALTGLDVMALITRPDGSSFSLPLLDNGQNSDLFADDGSYSVDIPYDSNGIYTAVVSASNASGQAQTSFEGVAIAVMENGTGVVPSGIAVPEPFTRTSVINVAVEQYSSDDHSNTPSNPAACTAIADDNLDTVGRIDSAGDVDCFFFQPTSSGTAVAVRATDLGLDIEAVLQVFDSSGTTSILEVDLASSSNSESGVIAKILAGSVDAAGHVLTVAHADGAAATGTYAVSVGEPLPSDEPVEPPTPPTTAQTCNGITATVVGTPGDDVLYGTSGDDVIAGLGGNDTIHGRDGNDIICGHSGDDLIFGGKGDDDLHGGMGNDIVKGSFGDDKIVGGGGNDKLLGSYGDDLVYGSGGNDRLYGNTGHDRLFGGAGVDYIFGSYGADTIYGGPGADLIRGNSNNDIIKGGSGGDAIDGGSGHDIVYGNSGADYLQGGTGYDQVVGGPLYDVCIAGEIISATEFDLLDQALIEDAYLIDDGSNTKPENPTAAPTLLHPTEDSAHSCEIEIGF